MKIEEIGVSTIRIIKHLNFELGRRAVLFEKIPKRDVGRKG